jgi:hypothetical protein
MRLRQLAWLPEQSFAATTKFLELAEKGGPYCGNTIRAARSA